MPISRNATAGKSAAVFPLPALPRSCTGQKAVPLPQCSGPLISGHFTAGAAKQMELHQINIEALP